MTLLDSNVLIRVITGDKPEIAEDILNNIEAASKNDYYIASVVLVEVCFVLEFHDYAMKRVNIYSAIKRLLAAPQITCSKTSSLALEQYKKHSKLDFTDCYLLVDAKQDDNKILTLDKDLQKLI